MIDTEYEKRHKSPWTEIGEVKSLHIYPLSWCQPETIKEIKIGHKGIILNENMWDNMFVAYNQRNNCIYDNNTARLSVISVKSMGNKELELTMFDFKLILNLDILAQNIQVKCIHLVDGKYIVKKKYYDCGDDAAEWLGQCVDDPYARLAYFSPSISHPKLKDCIQWLYPSAEYNEIRKLNPPIPPSCRVMSQESFDEVKKMVDDHIKMVDFYPNIVITTKIPFKEDSVEWFRIGESIVRTFRPRLRYEEETTFHAPIDMRMQLLSMHCETYMPGTVKIGDKVCTIDFEK